MSAGRAKSKKTVDAADKQRRVDQARREFNRAREQYETAQRRIASESGKSSPNREAIQRETDVSRQAQRVARRAYGYLRQANALRGEREF